MQEEAQRTHRRETLCSYHAQIGVRDFLSLLMLDKSITFLISLNSYYACQS